MRFSYLNQEVFAPYRLLFPLGVLGALAGVWPWVWPRFQSGQYLWHPELMVGAFLLPVALGFLLTALPGFLSADRLKKWEFTLFVLPLIGLWAAYFFGDLFWFRLLVFLLQSLTLAWAVGRFFHRRGLVPVFLPLVAWGWLAGWFGQLIRLLEVSEFSLLLTGSTASWLSAVARSLFFEAWFLFLLLGIGAKFVPMLTAPKNKGGGWPGWSRRFYFWSGAAIFFSYLAGTTLSGPSAAGESLFDWPGFFTLNGFAALIRWLVVMAILVRGWLIFHSFVRRGPVAWFARPVGLSLAVYLFPATFLLNRYQADWKHLLLVSGFGLAVLLVMSRVVLAHENRDTDLETRSRWFWGAFAVILLAMLARVEPVFVDRPLSGSHMVYAAVSWLLAWVLWLVQIGLAFRRSRPAGH